MRQVQKEKYRSARTSERFLSSESGGKMNRVCCGAVEIKVLESPLRPNVYKISYSKMDGIIFAHGL